MYKSCRASRLYFELTKTRFALRIHAPTVEMCSNDTRKACYGGVSHIHQLKCGHSISHSAQIPCKGNCFASGNVTLGSSSTTHYFICDYCMVKSFVDGSQQLWEDHFFLLWTLHTYREASTIEKEQMRSELVVRVAINAGFEQFITDQRRRAVASGGITCQHDHGAQEVNELAEIFGGASLVGNADRSLTTSVPSATIVQALKNRTPKSIHVLAHHEYWCK
jgi:hypothetical protein